MSWSRRDMKIAAFAERLMCEFPAWSTTQAVTAATTIIDHAAEMAARSERAAFIREARQGLAGLPVVDA